MTALDGVLDDLYGLPLAEFTAARNAASAALRVQGRPEDAAAVKALKKPTAAASALNQLGRRHPGELEAFLGAAAALRDVQLKGGDLQRATAAERQSLERLVTLARDALGGGSTAAVDRVRQSLAAAAVDDDAARVLRQGRLTDELEPAGFGSLLAHAPPAAARPAPKRPDRRALERAQARLRRAEEGREQARSELDAAEERRARARAALDAAEAELEEARRAVRNA